MSNFKAVLCCLNSKYIHSSLAPWCLFAACKKYCADGIDLTVCEGTVNENEQDVLFRLLNENPSAISFSCYIWNITSVLSVCKKIKECMSDCAIILGGPEASFSQEQILKENPSVDYVLSGEGEVSLPKLLNMIYTSSHYDIPALSYRTVDGVFTDNRNPETDESISPYCEEYFNSLNGRIAYIESSRGCPFSCAFCLSGRLGRVRYIELERVKNEMLSLARSGAKTVKFVDRTFNCNKQRAGEILEFISSEYGKNISEGTCFHFEIAADLLDEALFEIIGKLPSGAVQFEIGIQSFNEATLRAINRKTDIEKVTSNVKRLISFGSCHIHIDLIAGLPEEDYISFTKGFDKAYAIGANMLQLGFLKILKGSAMCENREKYPCEYSDMPPYEVKNTPWISEQELAMLHMAENELERLYNSGRFTRTLNYVLSAGKITPYELFCSFGEYLADSGEKNSIPLDRYVNRAYDYFSTIDGVDEMKLRDVMLYDRVETNNSGVIPERLKVADKNMKKVKNYIKSVYPQQKGVNRTVGILYSENKAIFSDYKTADPVSGKYQVNEVCLSDALI